MNVTPKWATPAGDDATASYVGDRYAFEEFQLWPSGRVLTRNNTPVQLGARALDILIALVERAGQVVDKTELFALVWPNRFVEESNLRVHMAAVRKALGDGRSGTRFIASVPGRGYTFVAEVVRTPGRDGTADRQGAAVASGDQGGLPAAVTRIFGRDEVVAAIADQLPRQRLVTICGTGGIGKTAVALAVARHVASAYRDGVQIVDLAPLANPALVAAHLASLLRLPADEEPLQKTLDHLQPRAQLIVLDNCEHVIDAASEIAEAILARATDVHVLATSREPLRAAGEWVQRLTPLTVPPATPALNVAEAMRFAAVQLFVERLRAYDGSFALADSDASVVADICARLDGLPLAIELAATRAPLFGVLGLAARLDDRFSILTKGRRTADPRHRTLGAMIAWSYEGLSDSEKMVFRRLGVLRSSFTIEAADAIANDKSVDNFSTVDILDDLLQKSLIVSDSSSGEPRYRLLESLRLYAFTKLLENREAEDIRRRHAQHWYERTVGSGHNWIEVPNADWLVKHSSDIADLRAALDWAFAPGGDPVLGVRIAAASAPVWFKMLLFAELRRYLEHAMTISEGMSEIGDAVRIRLNVALGHAVIGSRGWGVEETKVAFTRARELAAAAGNAAERFQIYYGIAIGSLLRGEPQLAEQTAEMFLREARAEGRLAEAAVAGRALGLACLYQGKFIEAHAHLEEAIKIYDPQAGPDDTIRFTQDHRAVAMAFLAEATWIRGDVGRARELMEKAIARATEVDHLPTLATVYLFKSFIGVLGGDAEAVLSGAESVIEICRQQFTYSLAFGESLFAWARARLGHNRAEAGMFADAMVSLSNQGYGHLQPILRGLLAELQAEERGIGEALREIDDALALAAQMGEHWCDALLHRIRGELLLKFHGANTTPAEEAFLTAIDIARQQKARSFELIAALALAKLYRSVNRAAEARAVLAPALEGFSPTPEFPKTAEGQALLDALAAPPR